MDHLFFASNDGITNFLIFSMDIHGSSESSKDLVLLVAENKRGENYIAIAE